MTIINNNDNNDNHNHIYQERFKSQSSTMLKVKEMVGLIDKAPKMGWLNQMINPAKNEFCH